MIKKSFFFFFAGVFSVLFLRAQEPVAIKIVVPEGADKEVAAVAKPDNAIVADSVSVFAELQGVLQKLYQQGYLEASFDSVEFSADTAKAFLEQGRQYNWVTLRVHEQDRELLGKIRYRERNWVEEPFNVNHLEVLKQRILVNLENSGFPFATVQLADVRVEEGNVDAELQINRNKLIVYDTLSVTGDAKVSRNYLHNYLNIKPGEPYSEKAVINASARLRELLFLAEERPLQVSFAGDKAAVYLFLQKQQSSQVNLLLGLQPGAVSGRFMLTGEANLNLTNPLGAGENFNLHYKRLDTLSQNFDAGFNYPYLLSLPVGVDFRFSLFRRGNSFLNLDRKVGIQYLLSGGNYVEVFWDNQRSFVLTVDTQRILISRQLPQDVDYRVNMYGITYRHIGTDYRFNPRRGIELWLSGAAGRRTVIKNNTISALQDPQVENGNFDFLYDTLNMQSNRGRAEYTLNKFWPLFRTTTIKTGVSGGMLFSEQYYRNELYRIGGYRHLRGFDEESMEVSQYHIFTFEYRILFARNSNIYTFIDGAYVQNRQDEFFDDFPYGFGAGLTLQTPAGLFNINYALGSQQGNPIDFRTGRIHFGYINYF